METNSNKNLIIGIVIAVIVIVGGYFIFSKNQPAALINTNEPIKIGFIGPLTGDAAAYGETWKNDVILAVDEINSNGGIKGRQIQMIYEDGKCTGQDSVGAAQKLINVDGVKIIIGGFCSGESMAITSLATQNKVLIFSPASSNPQLTNSSSYFFRDYPSDTMQGEVDADLAYNKKNWHSVAILQEQTDYAKGLNDSFSTKFQSFGGKIVNENFLSDATDFRSILLKLKNQNPDALFIIVQTASNGNKILKQLKDLNWHPSLLVSDVLMSDSAAIKTYATYLEGAVGSEFIPNRNDPEFQHLAQLYKTKFNVDLPYENYAATTYDAVYLLKDGISLVGDNSDKLAEWSRTIKDWKGASGLITITSEGDRVGGFVQEVIHSGEKEPLNNK